MVYFQTQYVLTFFTVPTQLTCRSLQENTHAILDTMVILLEQGAWSRWPPEVTSNLAFCHSVMIPLGSQVWILVLLSSTLGQHLSIYHLPLHLSLYYFAWKRKLVFIHGMKLWLTLAHAALCASPITHGVIAAQGPTTQNFSVCNDCKKIISTNRLQLACGVPDSSSACSNSFTAFSLPVWFEHTGLLLKFNNLSDL